MGTVTQTQGLVLTIPGEVLGPGSEYDKRRMALRQEYDTILAEAKKVTVIESPDVEEHVVNLGRLLQAGSKESEIFFTPIKRQIDIFKAPVLAHEREFCDPIDDEKKRLGKILTAWHEKCRMKREDEERKAREEAERQAREDKLARAVELEQAGDVSAAEQVLEEPIFTPLAVQSYAPPKTKGAVGKATYKCLVTDFMELVKAVAGGKAPIQSLSADQSFLDAQARSYRDGFSMPGCKLDKNNGTHFRA